MRADPGHLWLPTGRNPMVVEPPPNLPSPDPGPLPQYSSLPIWLELIDGLRQIIRGFALVAWWTLVATVSVIVLSGLGLH